LSWGSAGCVLDVGSGEVHSPILELGLGWMWGLARCTHQYLSWGSAGCVLDVGSGEVHSPILELGLGWMRSTVRECIGCPPSSNAQCCPEACDRPTSGRTVMTPPGCRVQQIGRLVWISTQVKQLQHHPWGQLERLLGSWRLGSWRLGSWRLGSWRLGSWPLQAERSPSTSARP